MFILFYILYLLIVISIFYNIFHIYIFIFIYILCIHIYIYIYICKNKWSIFYTCSGYTKQFLKETMDNIEIPVNGFENQ